ncbi:ATP-binding cassette domain-containing protein [Clostridium algidicarnis]|uniref:ATP-binding cassette domain-containing protein n=1 Tax=Clostridium algidicarnis TaxID=37659 RepID=UPI001C0D4932|nr:ABC transporter ATP-binding protein [Clostridium algidicarnis]MBU3228918.1 ABC transporter ATP-binding protein/permease [Clostridium algidicarnis]MBU3252462.1 ABC transporter ATP-binding protein/permease [Clostridium algidicarnis]
MKYYYKHIDGFKFRIASYFCLVATTWAINLMQPVIYSRFIDNLVEKKDFSYVKLMILLIIGINLLYICVGYVLGVTEEKLINKISYIYISDIINHFQHLPLINVNRYDPIYMTQRIKGDVSTIVSFLLKSIITICMNILCIIVSLLFLIKISNIFIYFFILFLPIYFSLYYVIKKPLYERGYIAKESSDEFIKILTQQMSLIKSIKIHSYFSKSINQINQQFNTMFIAVINYTKLSYIFSSLDHIITVVFQAAVFVIFAKQVYLNEISIGNFIMINTYFGFIINSAKYFMSLGKSYQDMRVSQKRLKEIRCQTKEHNGDKRLASIRTIDVQNLSFSYQLDKKDKMLVLDNVNLFFERNNIYIIKGKNGSGKSTLIDIIIGLYQQEVISGTIKFDNTEIGSMDMYWLRKNCIGFVSQTAYYGEETVLEFLKYNHFKRESSPVDFSSDIYINNTNNALTNEMVSKIKEHSMEKLFINENFNIKHLFSRKMQDLSGGQQQKILILREIITCPYILFFDEPTNSLDQKSILELKEIIQNIKDNRIILITTHDDYFDDIGDEEINLT